MSFGAKYSFRSILWRFLKKKQFNAIRPKLCHTLAFKIEGKTRLSHYDFTILAFTNIELANYISKISIIGEPKPVLFNRKCRFQEIPEVTADLKPDIVFVGDNAVYSNFLISKDFFLMPYVSFSLDISNSWHSILAKMHRTKRKKIRQIEKLGYTYEITKDMETFKLFYYKMYVPRILNSHGKSAETVPYSECERLFNKGGLLLVKLDGKYVAGAIYAINDNTLYVPMVGIDQEKQDKFKILGLLPLYFLILWGKEKGYTKINYGSCNPFLRSGTFQFKKELGMKIQPICSSDSRTLAMKFCNFDKGTQDFVLRNPFIFANEKELRGLVIFNPKVDFLDFYTPGLTALNILCPAQYFFQLKQRYPKISKASFDESSPIGSLVRMISKENYETYALKF